MRALALIVLILALAGSFLRAESVTKSPRPMPRPATMAAPIVADPLESTAAAAVDVTTVRPKPRPKGLDQVQTEAAVEIAVAEPATKKTKREKKSAKGSICGDPAIKGVNLARIKSKVKGCGLDDPVSVTSIDGIRLSQAATIDCPTANALKTWVQQSMRPAFGNREVVELRIAAHYICRSRNNIKGNKVSEHGRGKAIDIAGFVFSDGKSWTVAKDYNKQIRKAHKGACGIFGTTLGPGSDGYHEDHLHFDTASYRGGPYCR